jgi:anti-sigma factor RsiW
MTDRTKQAMEALVETTEACDRSFEKMQKIRHRLRLMETRHDRLVKQEWDLLIHVGEGIDLGRRV